MKLKFGDVKIEASEESFVTISNILQDAARYNLEKHYIKVHGDLMEIAKHIDNMLYISEVYHGQKSHRSISTTTQSKRPESSGKTRGRKKQTRVHKESDPE